MSLSFSLRPEVTRSAGESPRRRTVLVTGAAGTIGSYFAEHSHAAHDLRLWDRGFDAGQRARMATWGTLLEGTLADLDNLKAACAGVDTVLHLAGNPDVNATWTALLDANVIGAYHAMVAARAAGCRRVIFASSIHAVSGYPADVQVKTGDPVNPGDLYGVTKCFGEALGRYLAEQEGMSVIVLRIGGFQPRKKAQDANDISLLDAFVSRRDLNQLINRCIDAPDTLRFAIFHGLSDNRFKRLDISDARELVGYAPQDDFAEENPTLSQAGLPTQVVAHNLGDNDGQSSGIREETAGDAPPDPRPPSLEP